MKKIVINSKSPEDEILKKLQSITDFLISKNKLAKGDELVVGINDKEDGSFLVEIDASLMSPEDYKLIKKDLIQLGKIVSSDLKNFDEDPSQGAPSSSENEEPEKQGVVDENSIKPAIQVRDSQELLLNSNANMCDEFKSLLFSDDELKEAPENPQVEPQLHEDPKPEDVAEKPKEPEETPENLNKPAETHDDSKDELKGEKTFDSLYFSEDEINPIDSLYFSEDEINPIESLYFSEDEINPIDSLYFSEDELHDVTPGAPAREPDPSPAPAPVAGPAKKSLEEVLKEYEKTKKPYTKEAVATECGCTVEEVAKKMKEMKLMGYDSWNVLKKGRIFKSGFKSEEEAKKFLNSLPDKDKKVDNKPGAPSIYAVAPEGTFDNIPESPEAPEAPKENPAKPETPVDKVEALKNLARLNKEAKAGRQLNFVEKHFCSTVSSMFSDEEIAAAEKDAAEVDKGKTTESKMEMVRRLNKEQGKTNLAQHCKDLINNK